MKRPTVVALAVMLACLACVAGKCTREPASTGGGGQIEIPGPAPANRNTRITNVEKGYWKPRN